MIEDLASLKAATVGRGGSHVREGYSLAPNTVAADWPARDTTILNILNACKATLGTGQLLNHRERRSATQSNDDRAHAPAWALNPSIPAAGCEAFGVRASTLDRGEQSNCPYHYATCIDGQRYRLSTKRKSRDYRADEGLMSNPMICNIFLKPRKAVHPGLSRTRQYAILKNSI